MAVNTLHQFDIGALPAIDHGRLAEVIKAGAVEDAQVYGARGGWHVVVKAGGQVRALAASRSGHLRLFTKIDTLISYLAGIGISHFQVDATRFADATIRTRTRADRSEAMRATHEAAAYVRHLQEAVQAARDETTPRMPNELVEAEFAERRAAARKKGRDGSKA
ncbi:hypothetical protein RKE25_23160 (plasmid) [Dyella sp. BiH032]|uniref:hypothetical protein n=1 Tax=Dyella sp. BiH032 TaxID=3075430 RepID=UPI0028930501|nr:hypothetical protein [Dyella sp. BiH032]WNL48584.1 hypothetical protein RKE25_23160 [Dyella sp. BiH032]